MDKVIRWGILGTGQIARALAHALDEVVGAKLVAVASRSSAGAEKFGRDFGVKRCHASYQGLADDPEVDVIYIATPHALHAENALLCLNGGKHVLCEKAFTMNRRQAQEVVALARQKNLFLMEAMWSRFLPAIVETRRIIASGEIGPVRQIQSDFGFVPDVGPQHRLLNRELGGGALLDIGVYPLSLSAFFLGPVESVQAIAELGPTGVDEQTAFSLRHQGGGVSSCVCSIRAHSPTEMTISGALGHIRIQHRFFQAQTLTVTAVDGAARTVEFPHIGSGYTHEVVEVMRCLRAGLIESASMPHEETLALMGILDTIRAQIGLSYSADLAQKN
ncbi:putative dehydrogenase [Oxalobacteraceae bacterium GrIS 1.11]